MLEICFIVGIVVITAFMIIKQNSFWSKKHQALCKHFNGQISENGSCVTFHWKKINVVVRRLSSGRGLGGTGSFGSLQILLEESKDLLISLDHMKKLVVKGDDELVNVLLNAISSDKDLELRLKNSLSVSNSTIKCESTIHLDSNSAFKNVHSLAINGLSVPYLEEPATLETEIETLLALSKLLQLTPLN